MNTSSQKKSLRVTLPRKRKVSKNSFWKSSRTPERNAPPPAYRPEKAFALPYLLDCVRSQIRNAGCHISKCVEVESAHNPKGTVLQKLIQVDKTEEKLLSNES